MSPREPRHPIEAPSNDVDAFLEAVAETPVVVAESGRGRLIFAIDATASRQPTWDLASHWQARMFEEAARLGTLDVQLAYFRGYGEFHVLPWTQDARELQAAMLEVHCRSGLTQVLRVLDHALAEHRRERVSALVYVGDCLEEDPEAVAERAARLGLEGLPAFVFHEGHDPVAAEAFRRLARLSGGAYAPFDQRSPALLGELLGAVAAYAVGGLPALEDQAGRSETARRLLIQLRR